MHRASLARAPLWPLLLVTLAVAAAPAMLLSAPAAHLPIAARAVQSLASATVAPSAPQLAAVDSNGVGCVGALPVRVKLEDRGRPRIAGAPVVGSPPCYSSTGPPMGAPAAASPQAVAPTPDNEAAPTVTPAPPAAATASPPQPAAPAATTPVPTTAPIAASADAGTSIYARLLSGGIGAVALPPGFALVQVHPGTSLSVAFVGPPGLLGEVDVELAGPDVHDQIAFLVFSSADAAGAALQRARVAVDEQDPLSILPYGAAVPIRCRSAGGGAANDSGANVTACFSQSGSVLVVGLSAGNNAAPTQQIRLDRAVALLTTGLRQLVALTQ